MSSNTTSGHVNIQSNLYIPPKDAFIPLIINGEDIKSDSTECHYKLPSSSDPTMPSEVVYQGTTPELTQIAIESAERAFTAWSQTGPALRRRLLMGLATIIRENESAIRGLIKDEIHCDDNWTFINCATAVSIIEETAASISSDNMNGQILASVVPGAYPMVFNEPYGVILGMAPWNAPLILGLRSIVAAVAAGNTVIFKGSELSPRTHYVVADLFRRAGFPAGVCNLILHRPEDASATYKQCVSHRAVKKVNFTGSTAVGRIIATEAGKHLKPVLLELGGKNISVVFQDADIDRAAKEIIDAATINNGQVCMCTDTVLVHHAVAKKFTSTLHHLTTYMPNHQAHLMTSKSRANIDHLLKDAEQKGATLIQADGSLSDGNLIPVTLIDNVRDGMVYNTTESFGPLLAIRHFASEEEVLNYFHESGFGLSSSVFSKNHLRAINFARKLDVGAVHINAGSVHDEGNFPHGGNGLSGFGRFGGAWALREFTRTKTVMVYPDESQEA